MCRVRVAVAIAISLHLCDRPPQDVARRLTDETLDRSPVGVAFLSPNQYVAPKQYIAPKASRETLAVFGASLYLVADPAQAADLPYPLDNLDSESFGFGILFGIFATLSTIVGILSIFFTNLRGGDLDGTTLASTGGLVMPSFFFQRAEDFFSSVKEDAARSQERFKESGRFEDIYSGIENSQNEALLRSVEELKEKFPQSGTRELVFGAARSFASSSTRVAATLYDFALRLQAISDGGKTGGSSGPQDILEELWNLDESRCRVSGRKPGQGGRRPWVNQDAEILVDQQVAALRRTVADIAQRPLFARVAPEILARPTYLAMVRLFDVFQPAETCEMLVDYCKADYSETESVAIDQFLDAVARSLVMRRAFRHIVAIAPVGIDLQGSWKKILRRIWFQRRDGTPCVFEHVFLGNQSEDISGQPIAGGLHCWLKFYLEEARGTAKYLGYIYNCPESGLSDCRFVSGKFVWDHAGYRLVKEQGGFFVGSSPEWQLACGTVAYFESLTPSIAESSGWEPWLGARTTGYTKDMDHDGSRYRHFVCCSSDTLSLDVAEILSIDDLPNLCTTYTSFLGAAAEVDDDSEDTAELDNICSSGELMARLPNWLVTEGIAIKEDSTLSRICANFAVERGCKSLREALAKVRSVFQFELEDAVAAAADGGFPRIRALVDDTQEVATVLLEASEGSELLSEALPGILDKLRAQGRRGPRLHQPLRLLLTGRAEGAPVGDIFRLLELAEPDGGEEVGVRLPDRIHLVRELFPPHEAGTVGQDSAPTVGPSKLQMVS